MISMILLAGCASHPTSAPSSTASAAPPTIAIQRTDAEARATLSAVAVQRQISDAVKNALKNGYHGKTDGGERVYCRVESRVGTHFTNEYCYTPEQLAKAFSLQDETQDMLRQPMTCNGGMLCNGGAANFLPHK
jgi:hypothetical protein